MALCIISRALFASDTYQCKNNSCKQLHPTLSKIHKIADKIDPLIGITLIVLAILAANGVISLNQREIYAVLGVGLFEISQELGRLIFLVGGKILHYKLDLAAKKG